MSSHLWFLGDRSTETLSKMKLYESVQPVCTVTEHMPGAIDGAVGSSLSAVVFFLVLFFLLTVSRCKKRCWVSFRFSEPTDRCHTHKQR